MVNVSEKKEYLVNGVEGSKSFIRSNKQTGKKMRQLVYKERKTLCWSWVGRKEKMRGRISTHDNRVGAVVLCVRSKRESQGEEEEVNYTWTHALEGRVELDLATTQLAQGQGVVRVLVVAEIGHGTVPGDARGNHSHSTAKLLDNVAGLEVGQARNSTEEVGHAEAEEQGS